MSQIVTQNPGSSEIQSPLIAGITEGLNKLSSVLNLKTGTLEDVQLTAVSIDNDEKNKNRIFEANFGNRLWLSSPAPVIKKNGSEITQSGSNFTIDYIGGSITFSAESKPADGDVITVSATYIIAESEALTAINTALAAVQAQSNKYKGNYDNVGALQLAYSSAENGDYAIVFDPLSVYAWKNDGWYDTRSVEDLSDYYNKEETDNLLGQKEPSIQQKGTSTSDDDYYWGGRKTWQDFKNKVRSTVLTGLSTASDAVVSATDTVLVAVGKLQAQVSKATQRAYLTGTGAPSTSTVGAVGQRYVNTSNGDEYTCEEVSGDTYTWRLHTRSVNSKRPSSPGGNIQLEASDVGALPEDGNAATATKLQTAVNIGNASFDGTGDATLADIGVGFSAAVITPGSGWGTSLSRVLASGVYVDVYISLVKDDNPVYYETICTLPENARPQFQFTCPAVFRNANNGLTQFAVVELHTNGEVKLNCATPDSSLGLTQIIIKTGFALI